MSVIPIKKRYDEKENAHRLKSDILIPAGTILLRAPNMIRLNADEFVECSIALGKDATLTCLFPKDAVEFLEKV